MRALLLAGAAIALVGLLRGVSWGYFAWSQASLSFLVAVTYIGWYRRERDYITTEPDADAIDQGPPLATWEGALFVLGLWLVVGLLSLAVRQFRRRRRAQVAEGG